MEVKQFGNKFGIMKSQFSHLFHDFLIAILNRHGIPYFCTHWCFKIRLPLLKLNFLYPHLGDREMAAPVKLRIILGENDSQRLILPGGMPETVIELVQEIKRQCGVDGDFRLQFMDVEFGNEFTNLVSM